MTENNQFKSSRFGALETFTYEIYIMNIRNFI